MTSRVHPLAIFYAANADRWTTRASRMRAHIWITPHGLEYRSR